MELKDLQGYKTYIVVVATICYALGGAVAGFLDWGVAIPLILGALGLGGLRNALDKPIEVKEISEPESVTV